VTRLRAVGLLLLGLLGCLPTVDVSAPQVCEALDAGVATPSGRSVLVGERTTEVLSRRAASCPPPADSSLAASVTDAAGADVPFELAGPFLRGPFVTGEISFTPARPGVHRVELSVEPSLGRAASEVVAARSSSLGARLATFVASTRCLAEGVTSAGAWVCQEADPARPMVSFWRGSQMLQRLDATGFSVVQDVVWVHGPGGTERFVDRGGAALVREPDARLAVPAVEGASLVAVDGRALLLGGATGARLLELTGMELTATLHAVFPRGLCVGDAATVVPGAGRVVTFACASRTGWARVCRVPLDAPDQLECRESEGELLGATAHGAWPAREIGRAHV
jgi:hypothetical protein